ncbi:hypothetical protein D7V82_22555 [bacterium 1xD8-6]|nr:hypothetical protein D7V72_22740 [bacterium D16-36]RKI60550.1 hypothetical protein D7V82_22555 [bacterium 1xD8-6]
MQNREISRQSSRSARLPYSGCACTLPRGSGGWQPHPPHFLEPAKTAACKSHIRPQKHQHYDESRGKYDSQDPGISGIIKPLRYREAAWF